MNEDKPERMPNTPPFVRFVCSAIPMVFDDSLSYYEALCALWKYVQGMTDVINNNATLEEEYIEKFNELKTFVDTYFDNLDVQEEINNKLDQMAEDGELTPLIKLALNPDVAWTFDTVADMKASTNLVDGCFARTLGFHSVGDGGGALYKISDSGTANEMDVIAVGVLYANLVSQDYITPEMYGAYGDGTHDDTTNFQAAVDEQMKLVCKGNYLISSTINIYSYSQITFCDGGKITFTGSSSCIKGTSVLYAKLENIRIESSDRTGIGILLEKSKNCEITTPHLYDLDTAIKIDGVDEWSASNVIYNPFIYKFNLGIYLTANAGKQTNDTKVIGGYIIDEIRTITDQNNESVCVKVDASCDTNIFVGVAVEDADIGFLNQSAVASTPFSLIGCRSENMQSYNLRSTAACKNLNTIDCNFRIDDAKTLVTAMWDQNIDGKNIANSYFGSATSAYKKTYYYDTGNNKRTLMEITSDGIVFGPSNGSNQHVQLKATDSTQVPKTYINMGGTAGMIFPRNFVMKSTNKYFKVDIDDSGNITTSEVTI